MEFVAELSWFDDFKIFANSLQRTKLADSEEGTKRMMTNFRTQPSIKRGSHSCD